MLSSIPAIRNNFHLSVVDLVKDLVRHSLLPLRDPFMDSDEPLTDHAKRPLSAAEGLGDQPSDLLGTTTEPPAAGSSGRCLLYGCSVVFISGIFLILCAGFGTYFYFTRQVKNFTSETAQVLPTQEYDEAKMVELEGRVQDFERTLEIEEENSDVVPEDEADAQGEVAAPEGVIPDVSGAPADSEAPLKPMQLVLSAADLNALIARKAQLKNKLFLKIKDGVITGDVSLPLDNYLPGGKGRFFNGSGTFDVKLQEGELVVRLVDAMVGGAPIPPAVMSEIRKQNLASEFQKDAKTQRSIRRFQQIEIDGDRMILTLKDR